MKAPYIVDGCLYSDGCNAKACHLLQKYSGPATSGRFLKALDRFIQRSRAAGNMGETYGLGSKSLDPSNIGETHVARGHAVNTC